MISLRNHEKSTVPRKSLTDTHFSASHRSLPSADITHRSSRLHSKVYNKSLRSIEACPTSLTAITDNVPLLFGHNPLVINSTPFWTYYLRNRKHSLNHQNLNEKNHQSLNQKSNLGQEFRQWSAKHVAVLVTHSSDYHSRKVYSHLRDQVLFYLSTRFFLF